MIDSEIEFGLLQDINFHSKYFFLLCTYVFFCLFAKWIVINVNKLLVQSESSCVTCDISRVYISG